MEVLEFMRLVETVVPLLVIVIVGIIVFAIICAIIDRMRDAGYNTTNVIPEEVVKPKPKKTKPKFPYRKKQ